MRSAIIGIHPGRITTYFNASRRAVRRRDSWYGSPWGRISAHLGPTCGRMSLGSGVSASLGHRVVSIFWRASVFWRGSVFSVKFHLSTRSCCLKLHQEHVRRRGVGCRALGSCVPWGGTQKAFDAPRNCPKNVTNRCVSLSHVYHMYHVQLVSHTTNACVPKFAPKM